MGSASALAEVQPSSVAASAVAPLPFELELGADRKLRSDRSATPGCEARGIVLPAIRAIS